MKTKIKLLIILMAAFAISVVAGIAAGCSIGESTPKDAADGRGMTACVTYYANGGSFTESSICYKTIYYQPGTPVFNIGVDDPPTGSKKLAITSTDQIFVGWVEAELDANGNPILLEMDESGKTTGKVLEAHDNGTALIIGEDGKELTEQEKSFTAKLPDNPDDWVFAFENSHPKLKEGEHKYYVAVWAPDVVLEYVLASEEAVTFNLTQVAEDGTESVVETVVQPGEVIKTSTFGIDGTITARGAEEPAEVVSNHSYIYLYKDAECTVPATAENGNKYERPSDGENAKIYVKYVPGRWTPVSTALNVSSMFSQLGSNNYYFVEVGTIDCSTTSLALALGTFAGTIEGNGVTLKNLNFSSSPTNGASVSMFGSLSETAVIRNLNIETVKATVTLRSGMEVNLHALFSAYAAGAKLENVSVKGYSLNVTLGINAGIKNIQQQNDGYITTNWLYGGFNSDEEFVSQYGEKIVTKAALTINNNPIVQEDSNE